MNRTRLTIGQCATLACLLEVTAPKPGNVHRGADFEDVMFTDFAVSAVVIGPVMDRAVNRPPGETILDAVRATRDVVQTNTNLGTILLVAPLAAVPISQNLPDSIVEVLQRLTADDSRMVYEAIRLANPGGLGHADVMDVEHDAPDDLLEAMRAAASRDLVARQYAESFSQVFGCVVPWIIEGQEAGWSLTETIIHTQLRLMSEFPDSLIARKCGQETAQKSAVLAHRVLDSGQPGDADYVHSLGDLDFWLRSDHHRRNPGTTADMIAAGLFAALRDEIIQPPFR